MRFMRLALSPHLWFSAFCVLLSLFVMPTTSIGSKTSDCAMHVSFTGFSFTGFSSPYVSHPAGVSEITVFGRGARRRRRSICGKSQRLWRGGGRVRLLFPSVNAVRFMLCRILKVRSVSIISTFEPSSDSVAQADTPHGCLLIVARFVSDSTP